jgi:predicted DCC family thiol-disulfide oxidoreductase YuxK
MEVKYLAKKDLLGKIKFTDLEDPSYDGKDKVNGFVDYATGMKHMHAVRSDGEVITGVRVFRELYDAIGMGWLYSFTKLPVLGPLIDKLYLSWATYRTNLTRGVGVQTLIDQRNAEIEKKIMDNTNMKSTDSNNCEAFQNAR